MKRRIARLDVHGRSVGELLAAIEATIEGIPFAPSVAPSGDLSELIGSARRALRAYRDELLAHGAADLELVGRGAEVFERGRSTLIANLDSTERNLEMIDRDGDRVCDRCGIVAPPATAAELEEAGWECSDADGPRAPGEERGPDLCRDCSVDAEVEAIREADERAIEGGRGPDLCPECADEEARAQLEGLDPDWTDLDPEERGLSDEVS